MRTNIGNYTNNEVYPLMMNFTEPSPIETAYPEKFEYNDIEQIVYNMRTVGTRCTRCPWTAPKKGCYGRVDSKTEVDDSKYV